jgi:hypothetical protein
MALLNSCRIWRVVLLGILASGTGGAEIFNEYHVKAAFLYTFAKFVVWPPQAFPSPSAEFAICVLGTDPFGDFLDDAVRDKTIDGRPLGVHRMLELPVPPDCKILFIAASERHRMPALLALVAAPGVLTVGDTVDFAVQGGVIGLRLDGERIRLAINLPASDKATLRISSRLLSLAAIVR